MYIHTIEAVIESVATAERDTLNFLSWEEGVKCQAQEIVAKSADEALPVKQATKAGPTDLCLELIQAEG